MTAYDVDALDRSTLFVLDQHPGAISEHAYVALISQLPAFIERMRELEKQVAQTAMEQVGELPTLTERQAAAFSEAMAEAQKYVDTSTLPTEYRHWDWHTRWGIETRPGRGHDFDGTWSDGEYLVQIQMDVYGYPAVSVSATSVVHNSSDEQCECYSCVQDREDDA